MEIQANWVRQEQLEREYLDLLSSSMNWIASTKANVYPLAHTKFLIYTTDKILIRSTKSFFITTESIRWMLRWKPMKDLFVNNRPIIEPQVSVPETKYALVPDQVKLSPAFYHNERNCVSFC